MAEIPQVDLGSPAVQANTPAALGSAATTTPGWGDVLKGVVGNPNFMPMVLMTAMMAANRKKKGSGGMAAVLPMMMMMQQFQGKGQTAPVPLPAAT